LAKWVRMNPCGTPVLVGTALPVPFASTPVPAGFPSPAADCAEDGLDLTRRFVRNPPATFVVRADGVSLTDIGIRSGDYLVVDRSREALDGDVVIALCDGAFTAKIFRRRGDRITLQAAHPAFPVIIWRDGCEIWGVVTSVHRDLTCRDSRR